MVDDLWWKHPVLMLLVRTAANQQFPRRFPNSGRVYGQRNHLRGMEAQPSFRTIRRDLLVDPSHALCRVAARQGPDSSGGCFDNAFVDHRAKDMLLYMKIEAASLRAGLQLRHTLRMPVEVSPILNAVLCIVAHILLDLCQPSSKCGAINSLVYMWQTQAFICTELRGARPPYLAAE